MFIIGGIFCMILVLCLAAAYLQTFRKMRNALQNTTENDVSMQSQIFYILLLAVLSGIQLSMTFVGYMDSNGWYMILKIVAIVSRLLA